METTIDDAVYIRPELTVIPVKMTGTIMITSNDDGMINGGFLDE